MIYSITNRKLTVGGEAYFFQQLEKIAAARPDGIILREKDLDPSDYLQMAKRCMEICRNYDTPLILNHFWETARELGVGRIHLSMAEFQILSGKSGGLDGWERIGVSVHSREEALCAQEKGADYLIAGHIFVTDCKKGLAPRGLAFLEEICKCVSIPVFAIGGMNILRGTLAIQAGAAGICMMSELMKAKVPEEIIQRFSGR